MRSRALGVVGFWLLSLSLVGCDRGSASELDDEPGPAAAGASTGSGGSSAAASESSDLTLGSRPATTGTCQDPQPWCLASCGGDEGEVGTCVGNKWQCPEGTVDRATCDPESCARHEVHCCTPNGEAALPPCEADGLFGECPSGFERTTKACVPAGLDISSCHELQNGMPCDSEDLVCNAPGCSGGRCSCQADESGKLSWMCAWNAC